MTGMMAAEGLHSQHGCVDACAEKASSASAGIRRIFVFDLCVIDVQ
jgi:hypothetical protein